MPKYSSFKYGAETYGPYTPTTDLAWTFNVAWDGSFSGIHDTFNNEAMRMVDLTVVRGRDNMLAPDSGGFERFASGEVVGIFDNEDGRYNPWNTDSPIYPYVSPGKFVKIGVKDVSGGAGGTHYGIMQGIISDIQPFNRGKKPYVRITVRDGLTWLRGQTVNSVLYKDGTITDALTAILAAAAWPWESSLATSDLMDEEKDYWWLWEDNVAEAISDLAEAEVGVYFHGSDGIFYFFNRDYEYAQTIAVAQTVILKEITVPQPWELIRNEIRVSSWPKAVYGGAVLDLYLLIGSGGLGIEILNGETFTVDAKIANGAFPFQIVPDPDHTATDHSVTENGNGTGDDYTADCPLTYDTPVSEGTTMTVVNNSGHNGWLQFIWIGGKPVYAPNKSTAFSLDATSQAAYGQKTLTLDSFWQENTGLAPLIANWLLAELKDPLPVPTIQFENRPAYQFGYDLYDQVVLTVDELDIDAQEFRIGKIEHHWLLENGSAVRTVWKLEPYLTPYT